MQHSACVFSFPFLVFFFNLERRMQFGGDELPFPYQQVSWFWSCLFALLAHLIRNDDATVKKNDYRILISAITGNSHPPIPFSLRALNIVSDFLSYQQRHSATLPQDFPSPTGREYILRTTIPKPRPSSRPCPQRMYCVLTNDEFRLAGAFTDDVIFQ